MKYLKKIDTNLMKLRYLLTAAFLVILSVNSSYAEDIEIYEGISDPDAVSALASDSKPNILFLLDTSGSMAWLTAVPEAKPAYDKDRDYDSSTENSNVYIYDAELSYTGMFVESDKNKCKAAADYHVANEDFPEYRGKALVWETISEADTEETVCTPGLDDIKTVNSTPYKQTQEVAIWEDASGTYAGKDFTINIENDQQGKYKASFYNSAGDKINTFCNINLASGYTYWWWWIQNEDSCSGTIPADATKIVATYKRKGNANATRTSIVSELSIGAGCVTNTISNPASGDWKASVNDVSSYDIKAIECEADSGVHGDSQSSADKFAQYDPLNTSPSVPKYVSTSNNPDAVNWESGAILERYLIPGNYHDYLQASAADLLANPAPTITTVTPDYNKENDGANDWCYNNGSTDRVDRYISIGGDIYQCQRRITVMKDATKKVIDGMSGVNVGIMRFNYIEGGSLVSEVKDIDQGTNKADIISELLRLPASGATPLQESLYEAYAYFAGKSPQNKSQRLDVTLDENSTVDYPTSLTTTTQNKVTPVLALDGDGDYISPIKNHCQDNNIILFSDGEPTYDTSRSNDIRVFSGRSCSNNVNGDCLDELTYGLANKKVNNSIDQDNFVYTHTIAFANKIKILEDAAKEGLRPGADKQSYRASDSQELTNAFQSILTSIKPVDYDSFVAPAVSVNAFNRISNNDELYYAVFEPEDNPRWPGNVKKYKLSPEGVIEDANQSPAIDDSTGFFLDSAQSYWSKDVDGADVRKGGFARELEFSDVNPRTLYAITGNSDTPDSLTESNFLDTINRQNILLGEIAEPDVDTNKLNIVKWTLGQDVEKDLKGLETDPNYYVGESLHSSPAVVSMGSNEDDPKSVIFSATNQGMLHAIDAEDGEELWSYIPDPDLFKNLGGYFNRLAGKDHIYGLDGGITFDVVRDPASKKVVKADLFMGQRRGGSKYFAIDVLGTLPKSSAAGGTARGLDAVLDENGSALLPVKRKWTKDLSDAGFDRLGQTWAKPVPLVVKYCGTTDESTCSYKKALVLAGGYDPEKYDDDALVSGVTAQSPAKGNEIYIVERETGNLLWKASSSYFPDGNGNKMIHSFPSSPTVVDTNFDGVADMIYASDISGQVWRFDFRGYLEIDTQTQLPIMLDDSDILAGSANEDNGKASVIGGIVADLSEEGNISRRFYNELSVSLTPTLKDDNGNLIDVSRYNIVLGSGYRAHPLSEETYPAGSENVTDNRLFVVYDRNLQFPKPIVDGSNKLTGEVTYNYNNGNVIDIDNIKELTSDIDVSPSGDNYHGYYIALEDDYEKVLNPSLTQNYKIFTVSYTPASVTLSDGGDVCNKNVGTSRLYVTDLLSGATLSKVLQKPGLSPEPVLIAIENDDGSVSNVLCIGTQCLRDSYDEKSSTSGGNDNLDNGVPLGGPTSDVLTKKSWWEEVR